MSPGVDYWSPPEIALREENRKRLIEVLGDEEWTRLFAYGAELSIYRAVDIALRRSEISL
jgi:hypothetical protein